MKWTTLYWYMKTHYKGAFPYQNPKPQHEVLSTKIKAWTSAFFFSSSYILPNSVNKHELYFLVTPPKGQQWKKLIHNYLLSFNLLFFWATGVLATSLCPGHTWWCRWCQIIARVVTNAFCCHGRVAVRFSSCIPLWSSLSFFC